MKKRHREGITGHGLAFQRTVAHGINITGCNGVFREKRLSKTRWSKKDLGEWFLVGATRDLAGTKQEY